MYKVHLLYPCTSLLIFVSEANPKAHHYYSPRTPTLPLSYPLILSAILFINNLLVPLTMRDDKTIITVSLTLEAKRNLDRLADEYTNGNRSAWVQRAIDTSAMVRFLKDLDHTGSEAHRKNRIDGKCNPQLVPKCAICWEMNA